MFKVQELIKEPKDLNLIRTQQLREQIGRVKQYIVETQRYAEASINPAQLRFNDRQPVSTRNLNLAYEPSTDPNRSQLDNTARAAENYQGNNALGGQLDNNEAQGLRTLIQNRRISPRQIAGEIVNNPRLNNNAELRSSVEAFMETLNGNNREGLAYTNNLLTRENNPLTDNPDSGSPILVEIFFNNLF